MSGVCKKSSKYLTHGNVGKAMAGCPASGVTNTKVANKCSLSLAKKGDGMTQSFNVNGKVTAPKKGDNQWTGDWGWSKNTTLQVDGLTLNLKMDNSGKLGGWVDWGEPQHLQGVLPGATVYTGFDYHTQKNTHMNSTVGLVFCRKNWGFVSELHQNSQQEKAYKEKCWWKQGPVTVSSNGSFCLQNFKFNNFNLDLNYDVNKNLRVHVGMKGKQSYADANLMLSGLYNCGVTGSKMGVCVSKQLGDKGKWNASVGCQSKQGSLAMDVSGNVKLGQTYKLGDHVKLSQSWGVNLGSLLPKKDKDSKDAVMDNMVRLVKCEYKLSVGG